MKRFLLLLLIALLAFGTQSNWAAADDSPAKESKPVAVVSLAGYDAFMGDINYMAKLANNPQLGVGLEGLIKLFTKNQGLAGLDKARPWGAVLQAEEENLTGYAFIPVTDLAKLGNALEGFIGKPEKVEEGLYKIRGKRPNDRPLFVKEGKGWAFLADKQENLTNLPDDPSALLAGLEKQYQIAFRLNAANVPEKQQQKFIEEMKKGAKRDAEKHPGESDEDHALRLKITDEVVSYLEKALGELQEITLGWNLETQAEKCYLDVSVVAKPGSDIAKAAGSLRDSHSRFAGFRSSEAAISGNLNGQLPAIKADLLKEIFDAIHKKALADIEKKEHDPAKAETGKQFVEKLMSLLQDTVVNGRVDKGVTVVLKPNAVTFLAGGTLVNKGRLEEMAKLALETAKKDHPQKASEIDSWVKFNAETYKGVALHTVSIPIPADAKDRERVVSLIGETLEVVLGTSNESMYIAFGREPLAALKKAIDQSAADASKSVLPLDITVSLQQVAEFIAAVGEPRERPRAAKLAAAFQQVSGGDHVILRGEPIDNGVKYRLEVEPGVLKAFGKMQGNGNSAEATR